MTLVDMIGVQQARVVHQSDCQHPVLQYQLLRSHIYTCFEVKLQCEHLFTYSGTTID